MDIYHNLIALFLKIRSFQCDNQSNLYEFLFCLFLANLKVDSFVTIQMKTLFGFIYKIKYFFATNIWVRLLIMSLIAFL